MAEIKPKKYEFFRDIFDFVFGIENKRGDILDHWITFIDSFSFPPQDFYAAIEKELESRKIPSMAMFREEFAEGGVLSDKRIYLRMFRERLAIYSCAMPFGSGYVFSCRTIYVPALVRLWHILATLVFFSIVGGLLQMLLGTTFAVIATVGLVFALAGVFRNAAASAVTNLDAVLLRIPVVSTIYEDWFREETYYRVDTRLVYLKRIPELIRETAEHIVAAKGASLTDQFERTPIFGDLYKRRMPASPEEKT